MVPGQHDYPPGPQGNIVVGMGRVIARIISAVLAIWLVFMAIGWILAMLKTFLIIGLIAAAVFIVVTVLAKRSRRG